MISGYGGVGATGSGRLRDWVMISVYWRVGATGLGPAERLAHDKWVRGSWGYRLWPAERLVYVILHCPSALIFVGVRICKYSM